MQRRPNRIGRAFGEKETPYGYSGKRYVSKRSAMIVLAFCARSGQFPVRHFYMTYGFRKSERFKIETIIENAAEAGELTLDRSKSALFADWLISMTPEQIQRVLLSQ